MKGQLSLELFKSWTISYVGTSLVLYVVCVCSHANICTQTHTLCFRNAELMELGHRQCSLAYSSFMNRTFILSFNHSMKIGVYSVYRPFPNPRNATTNEFIQ